MLPQLAFSSWQTKGLIPLSSVSSCLLSVDRARASYLCLSCLITTCGSSYFLSADKELPICAKVNLLPQMPSSQTFTPVRNPISSDAGRPSPHTCAYLIASDSNGELSTSYLCHASSPQIPANQALTRLLNLPVETLRDPGLIPSDTNRLQTTHLCLLCLLRP